ncbi:MAG TPA: signal peptidase II [Dissulfurispiraceae bacterium]|nr:signal peptidase II [Dissulfurispiraceae bacterium]
MPASLFSCTLSTAAAFAISFVVYLLDQITKYAVRTGIGLHETISITSFFNLVYAENLGSAFGLFKSFGVYFFIAVALIASMTVAVLILKEPRSRLAFALVLGGALGNLTDRIANAGAVIDFLDFFIGSYHWPAFNVADIGLSLGISLLLLQVLFFDRHSKADL